MAFPGNMVWEVRTGGSDANGGGYTPTGGGTDYSQQDAAQVAYTDLVIDATTNTNATSAGTPFTSAHVGNVVNITGGTGFTVQRAYIVSVAAGVATFDRSLGTLSSTGGTGNLGGGMLTPEALDTLVVPGNLVYIASGTYTKTSSRTFTCDGTSSGGEIAWIGYPAGGTRSDVDVIEGSMPVITSATNSIRLMALNGVTRTRFRNLKLTHTAGTRGIGFGGVTATSVGLTFENCIADGCLNGWDFTQNWNGSAHRCVAKNSTSNGFNINAFTSTFVFDHCLSYSNAGAGFSISGIGASASGLIFNRCISYSNTGANGYGFWDQITTNDVQLWCVYENCVAYGNAQSGWRLAYTTGGWRTMNFSNCVSYGSSGGWGISCATAGMVDGSFPRVRNFAFGSNSSGARQNFRSGDGEITLTADPFTNAAGGDFSLNNTAGGGALLRQLGYPTEIGIKGSSTTHYPDVGAAEHQETAGGGTFAGAWVGN